MIRTICLTAASTIVLSLGLMIPAQADIENPGKMMLVLDSSGSMQEKAGGTTKIAAAKDALASVIAKLPTEQEVGLRVYGATVFSAKDKGACTDSQRSVDLGTANRPELQDAVDTYKPYGETPTGYALQQAAKDLGEDGQRTIVLVSDGESTCSPDPCAVAEDLAKDGILLRIDVVGLDVSGKARDQLKCVAASGKGTYYDANDAASLADSLDVSSTRASRPFDLTGEPVEGTADPTDAPVIARGQYLDTFGPGDGLWYKVRRTADNSTFHVGVTHRSADTGNFGDKAYIGVYAGADKDRCAYSTTFARGNIAYAAATSWKRSPDACNTAKTLWVNVKQASSRRDFAGEPVEIAVYEEPPVSDPAGSDLPATPAKPSWTTLSPSAPKTGVVPGTSISNAPAVSDGTYALDINPGETQVVAVPLDWGQNLQAQFDGKLTAAHRNSDFDAPWVQVLGPVRQAVDTDEYGVDSKPKDWSTRTSRLPDNLSDYRTGSQSYTIGYGNRAEVKSNLSSSSVPGLRYVQVSYPADNEAPITYTLTLKSNGKAGDGAPTYKEVAGLTAPAADSALVSGDAPASDPAVPGGTADQKSDSGGLPGPIWLIAIGVAVIAGAYVLIRRKRAAR